MRARSDLVLPAAAAVLVLGSADETAVAAEPEVSARITAAPNHRDHPEWLESGSLGQVGAAMAVARALALDPAKTLAALGIAATMMSGLAAAPGPAKAAIDDALAARLAGADSGIELPAGLSCQRDAMITEIRDLAETLAPDPPPIFPPSPEFPSRFSHLPHALPSRASMPDKSYMPDSVTGRTSRAGC